MRVPRRSILTFGASLLLAGGSAAQHPHEPHPLSVRQAWVLARSLNLRAADVLGFSATVGAERETTFTPGSTYVAAVLTHG